LKKKMGRKNIYINNTPLDMAVKNWHRALSEENCFNPLPRERVSVEDSMGRITAEPLFARTSSPFYNGAAMDGIAVRFRDLTGANEANPITLTYPDQYIPINTGNLLPDEFDAVVMIEDVQHLEENKVEIITPVTPWTNVRTIGEDIVATELIVPQGHIIRPIDQGAMLATGLTSINVRPIPKILVIPTGTDLVQPGKPLKPGDIIEFNSRVLSGYLRQWGANTVKNPIVPDDPGALEETIKNNLHLYDILLINAGASAGTKDYTHSVLKKLGKIIVHGVNIKPGKPVILSIVQGKPVIGLPGYPVSAVLTMRLFVKKLIDLYLGIETVEEKTIPAILSRPLSSEMGVENFTRVKLGRVENNLMATPTGGGAGAVMSLVQADGIIVIPSGNEGIGAGEVVEVELLRDIKEIENTIVFIGSHDNLLDVLANLLHKIPPVHRLSSAHVGSMGGIMAIKRKEAHFAGSHLMDEKTGEYNIPFIQRFLKGIPLLLLNLSYREQGIIIPRGNPANIKEFKDIARPGIKFINRQKGSGTRLLTDMLIKKFKITPTKINGYELEEYTHMNVASAVASNRGDAGMGIRYAAKALDLEFIPITEERYDLIIPKKYFDNEKTAKVLSIIRENKEFRNTVRAMGGYSLRDSGTIIYEQ